MKKIKLIALTFLLIGAQSFAQDEAVKELLNNYVSAVNKLPKTQKASNVTQYFHDQYKSYSAELGMSGIVNRTTSDIYDFEEQLQNSIDNSAYKLKLTVDKVLYVNQKNKVGTIAAIIDFESKFEDKIADKGTILLTIIATKSSGEWQIIHSNTTQISESKDVGQCSCNIYKKGEDSQRYLAEVFYPSGLEIGQDFSTYRIAFKKGKRFIISDNDDFIWNEVNEIYLGSKLIGKSEDIKEAIRLISEDRFKANCTTMIKI